MKRHTSILIACLLALSGVAGLSDTKGQTPGMSLGIVPARIPESFPSHHFAVILVSQTGSNPGTVPGAGALRTLRRIDDEADQPIVHPTANQLARIAQWADTATAFAAIDRLLELEAGRAVAQQTLLFRLDANRRAIEPLLVTSAEATQFKDKEVQLAQRQAEAMANIAKLEKGEMVDAAYKTRDELEATWEGMKAVYANKTALLNPVQERLNLFSEMDSRSLELPESFSRDEENALRGRIDMTLGMTPQQALEAKVRGKSGPGETHQRFLWIYYQSRQIDELNKILDVHMNDREIEHGEILNTYREALGMLRLEFDPRLVQSARRHSKHMVDHDYFSHTAPDPELKTFRMRMTRAGYPSGAGGENITYSTGGRTAKSAFGSWFSSPGHHRNMTRPGWIAVGIGDWGTHWTHNFGAAVMLLGQDRKTLENIEIKGEILEKR